MTRKKVKPLLFSLLFVSLLVFICVPAATAVVTPSYYTRFENIYMSRQNFPTCKRHPIEYNDYLVAGETGEMIVYFHSESGTGDVTVTVSSEAFASASTSTINIAEEDKSYTFNITFTVKSGIDGVYWGHATATNELGAVLDTEGISYSRPEIRVWSIDHQDAADILYTAKLQIERFTLGSAPMGHSSAPAEANITLAINEYSLAETAYYNKEWDSVFEHAENAIEFINRADAAEKEVETAQEEISEAANDENLAITNLLTWITYPLLVVTILAIVYIIVAIVRKIRPPPAPKRARAK